MLFKTKEINYMGWSIITNDIIYWAYSSKHNEMFTCDSMEQAKAEIRKLETEYAVLKMMYGDLLR